MDHTPIIIVIMLKAFHKIYLCSFFLERFVFGSNVKEEIIGQVYVI